MIATWGFIMTEEADYRDKFDRFAQHDYLQMLLKTPDDQIIPTLFLDLMDQVNAIQGKAGLILSEVERAENEGDQIESILANNNTVRILENAIDMSNVLKALMEYYELTQKSNDATPDN